MPIWAGIDDFGFFNKEAMLDVTGLSTLEISDRISKITLDEIMYRQGQPLLLREPKLDETKIAFKRLLSSNV